MTDLEHFSLRWNNFHSNMSAGFCALLQEDALVDVTLAAEGRFLQAHRLVLSVCSPYFKQLFAANPCKHPIVILKDVHHKQMSDLLNFMYQGEVNVKQEDLATFLRTAELLQIKGLTGQNSHTDQQQDLDHHARDEQHSSASTEHLPNLGVRHRAARRSRPQEKHAALATLISSSADAHLSPTPSPPPVKRVRPTASPVVVNPDDDLRDAVAGTAKAEAEGHAKKIKTEPSSDFDESFSSLHLPQNEDDESVSSGNDTVLWKALTSHSSQNHPISPLTKGAPHETEDPSKTKQKQSHQPAQFLLPEGSSAAGSSGVSLPASDGNRESSDDQGEVSYMTSKRGRAHLLHKGHRYYLHREAVCGRRFWRCLQHRTKGCRAYVSIEPGENRVGKRGAAHNHTPPYERLAQSWVPVAVELLPGNVYGGTSFCDDQFGNDYFLNTP